MFPVCEIWLATAPIDTKNTDFVDTISDNLHYLPLPEIMEHVLFICI
jgi:hypothetical protein